VSGRGRIIVSQITYEDVKKFDAELAATFVELEPVKVKGIREAVRNYEVPWKETEAPPAIVASVSEAAAAKA
jgi:class 3 adenylate cyclase